MRTLPSVRASTDIDRRTSSSLHVLRTWVCGDDVPPNPFLCSVKCFAEQLIGYSFESVVMLMTKNWHLFSILFGTVQKQEVPP